MTREEAIDLIHNSSLSGRADALLSYLSPSARVILQDEPVSGGSSASHFGGVPSFPQGVTWPRWDKRDFLKAEIASLEKQLETITNKTQDQPEKIPGVRLRKLTRMRDRIAKLREEVSSGPIPLAFLAQLSLSEIGAVAPLTGWPTEGTLAFFYDAVSHPWGFDPLDRGHCRVLFFTESEPLIPTEFPNGLAGDVRFPSCAMTFSCEWSLPDILHVEGDDSALWRTGDYDELLSKLGAVGSGDSQLIHRIGGPPTRGAERNDP
jgi:Domain of unknown function (DUF1963)